jgi:hypothetical protein
MGLEEETSSGGSDSAEGTPASRSDSDEAEADTDTDDGEPASQREARYRIRAREAERRLADASAENAQLHDRLDAMCRSQAVALATGRLAEPLDLFRDNPVGDVLAEDGSVDAARVTELCASLIEAHPHWAAARPAVNPNALRSGASKPAEALVNTFARAFAPPPSE